MNARQDDLFCAASQSGLNIKDHICNGTTASLAACNGGNAECTSVITAILHLDEGTRTAMQTGERLIGLYLEPLRRKPRWL